MSANDTRGRIAAMHRAGISLEQIARAAAVHPSTVRDIYHGRTERTTARVAAAIRATAARSIQAEKHDLPALDQERPIGPRERRAVLEDLPASALPRMTPAHARAITIRVRQLAAMGVQTREAAACLLHLPADDVTRALRATGAYDALAAVPADRRRPA